MKASCNMIRDLVGVVTDGAASNDTKAVVAAHLSGCPACARYYRDYARIAQARRFGGSRPVRGEEAGYRALTERLRQRRREEIAKGIGAIALAVGTTVLLYELIRGSSASHR